MPTRSRLQRERARLGDGPEPGERPDGIGTVRLTVRCPGHAAQFRDRVISVLTTVNQYSNGAQWPDYDEWRQVLPEWFLVRCAPEQSPDEAEAWLARWRLLPPAEQERIERETPWSLANWLDWLQPENRQWYWWDAEVVDADTLVVALEVDAWPFPWGAAAWLFRAAGAREVAAEV